MAYRKPDATSLRQSDKDYALSWLWTPETLAQSLNEVKQLLNWTPYASIEVGVNRERFAFDSGVMSAISPYFSHFSLPTMTYADRFRRLSKRLLAMTAEETSMFDLIIKWCHTPLDEPSPLFGMEPALSIEQWSYIWCLADTLQIINLRELVLAIVKARFENLRGCPDQLPSPTAVQYLHDARRNHDTYSESLWDEFAFQHKSHPNGLTKQGYHSPYVEAFIDEVLGWAKSSPDTLSHGYSPERDENECVGNMIVTDESHIANRIRNHNRQPPSPGWSAVGPETLTRDSGDRNEDWFTEFDVKPEEGDYAGAGEEHGADADMTCGR